MTRTDDRSPAPPVVRCPMRDPKTGALLGETRIAYTASLPAGAISSDEAVFILTGRWPE